MTPALISNWPPWTSKVGGSLMFGVSRTQSDLESVWKGHAGRTVARLWLYTASRLPWRVSGLSHPEVLIALRRARGLTDPDFSPPPPLRSMGQAAPLAQFHFAPAVTHTYGETPSAYS